MLCKPIVQGFGLVEAGCGSFVVKVHSGNHVICCFSYCAAAGFCTVGEGQGDGIALHDGRRTGDAVAVGAAGEVESPREAVVPAVELIGEAGQLILSVTVVAAVQLAHGNG